MNLNIENKTAIVTGASRGIGLAIKQALEKEGVKVTDVSRTSGYDVLDKNFFNLIADEVLTTDILINNVGGLGNLTNHPDIMYKNYDIMRQLTYLFLKTKRNYGRVITISSIYGKEKGHNPEFTASKAAQIAYMKSLAGNYENITFNTICPGHIYVGKPFPDNPRIIGQPTDVSSLVTFLCSNKAKHINGATITVDGGASHSF